MRKIAMAALAAAAFMMPGSVSAETLAPGAAASGAATELSSQVTVRVGPGHRRWQSRRADRRRCRTVRIKEVRPSGRVVRKTIRRCG